MKIHEYIKAGLHLALEGITVRYYGDEIPLKGPMLLFLKKSAEGRVSAAYLTEELYAVVIPIKALESIMDNATGEMLYIHREER